MRLFSERVEEQGANPLGRTALKSVRGHDALDHVALDVAGRTTVYPHCDDAARGEPSDRAIGAGPARRATERRNGQAGSTSGLLERPSTAREHEGARTDPGWRPCGPSVVRPLTHRVILRPRADIHAPWSRHYTGGLAGTGDSD